MDAESGKEVWRTALGNINKGESITNGRHLIQPVYLIDAQGALVEQVEPE